MTTSPEVGSIPATMAAGACCSKHDCSIVVPKQRSPPCPLTPSGSVLLVRDKSDRPAGILI